MILGDTTEDEKLAESNDEDNELENVVHQLNHLLVAEDLNKIHHEEISWWVLN